MPVDIRLENAVVGLWSGTSGTIVLIVVRG